MLVTAIKIDSFGSYIIHAFPRTSTGEHENDYVKIKKGGTRGKFRLDIEKWGTKCSLDESTKIKLKEYLVANKPALRKKIKDLL